VGMTPQQQTVWLDYGADDVVYDCWQSFNVELEDVISVAWLAMMWCLPYSAAKTVLTDRWTELCNKNGKCSEKYKSTVILFYYGWCRCHQEVWGLTPGWTLLRKKQLPWAICFFPCTKQRDWYRCKNWKVTAGYARGVVYRL